MRLGWFLFVGFFMVVLAGAAFAETPLSRSVREKAAKKACALGDFQKGAEILTDLFVETNDFSYIYNQARCYEQNSIFDQALNRFREWLRKAKDVSEGDRAEAERHIADCEAALTKATPPPVATHPSASAHRVDTTHPAAEPATAQVSSDSSPPNAPRGKGLRVSGIILASVGVAAIITGVAFSLKANSLSTNSYSKAREDERSSWKTGVWIGYGVGAAAIATGTILYIAGWPSDQSTSVALLPIVAPNEASVLLRGRF